MKLYLTLVLAAATSATVNAQCRRELQPGNAGNQGSSPGDGGDNGVTFPNGNDPDNIFSPTPGCNGIPTTTCGGFEYLKLVTGAELGLELRNPMPPGQTDFFFPEEPHIAWTKFFEATPAGCVLAPVNTEEDLLKAQAAVAPRRINAWVGLFKEAADICGGSAALLGDCPSGSNANAGYWKNLDGTLSTVANGAVSNIWRNNEPNNSQGVQQYVHLLYSDDQFRLRDENDQGGVPTSVEFSVTAAVYKCCNSAPLLTFPDCSA